MSVESSRTRLQQRIKVLMLKWDKANAYWDDKVSRDFKETVLDPLEPKIRVTMEAMEEMSGLLQRLKRECE